MSNNNNNKQLSRITNKKEIKKRIQNIVENLNVFALTYLFR